MLGEYIGFRDVGFRVKGLNSKLLKAGLQRALYRGLLQGLFRGDTRVLDYGSNGEWETAL